MGYYTQHTLSINDADENLLEEIFDYLKENEGVYYGLYIASPSSEYECSYDDCKWYEHEVDMAVLAKKFPTVTFILHGEGEAQGDIWEEMYHGKEVLRRHIVQAWGEWH